MRSSGKEEERLHTALAALNGAGSKRTGGRNLSVAAQARIAAAQRARWAKVRASKNQSRNEGRSPPSARERAYFFGRGVVPGALGSASDERASLPHVARPLWAMLSALVQRCFERNRLGQVEPWSLQPQGPVPTNANWP